MSANGKLIRLDDQKQRFILTNYPSHNMSKKQPSQADLRYLKALKTEQNTIKLENLDLCLLFNFELMIKVESQKLYCRN